MKTWRLENVVETALKNENTFFIPSEKERNSQKTGNHVRLHFLLETPAENEPRAERMWVQITDIIKSEIVKYIGVLVDDPVYIKDLKSGDVIEFDSTNIAQTIIKKDDPRWIDSYEKSAFVSKMFFEQDGVIRFMYREEPENDEDSGWRMFTGLEDDDYTNNPENIEIINVGYLLDKDPTLLEPLKNGYGVAFERDGDGAKWEKVDD